MSDIHTNFDVEEALLKLEELTNTKGTSLSRSLCDIAWLDSLGIEIPDNERFHTNKHPKESCYIWTLAIGSLRDPKKFFYAYTIKEVVTLALDFYTK